MTEVLALENRGLAHRTAAQAQRELASELRADQKTRAPKERLINREALADRFECSDRTIRRYEKDGLLTPLQLDPLEPDQIGYRMAEVIALEQKGV
jgi:hypothetical protein